MRLPYGIRFAMTVAFLTLTGWCIGFGLSALNPARGDPPIANPHSEFRIQHSPLPHVAVWLELNVPTDTAIASAIDGIRLWAECGAVDAVIVSTMPGREWLFTKLAEVCEEVGIKLIPGIKTSPALPTVTLDDGKYYNYFDDAHGWRKVADSVLLASVHAKSPIVLLENESAMRGYVEGLVEIDLARLSAALDQLPKQLNLVWYPSVIFGDELRRGRQLAVARTLLAQHPNVYFVDNSIDREWTYRSDVGQTNRTLLMGLYEQFYPGETRSLYKILYCYGPGTKWWSDAAIVPLLFGPVGRDNWAILYPGAKRFSDSAPKSLGPLLEIATHDSH